LVNTRIAISASRYSYHAQDSQWCVWKRICDAWSRL